MQKISLIDNVIAHNHFSKLPTIKDRNGSLVILPMLYSAYLDKAGEVFKSKEYTQNNQIINELVSESLADTSITTYIGHVYDFLRHVEEQSQTGLAPNVHQTYLLDAEFINKYLNEYLPRKLTSASLDAHASSLKSYFNFIAHLELINPPRIKVSRKARKTAYNNNQAQNKINYVSTDERNHLLRKCKSKRDRLILQMGFKVGLRTSESRGVLLSYKGETKGHLLELFEELANDPEKNAFRYHLKDKFTKGGKSRFIFFDRELVQEMKDYYETEREEVLSRSNNGNAPEALFLNDDARYHGKRISAGRPSRIFNVYLKQLDWMDQSLSYHDLRHTFATELYHSLMTDSEGNQTGSLNGALIEVAQRLGHAMGKDGKPAAVTTRYIRLMETMLSIEGAN